MAITEKRFEDLHQKVDEHGEVLARIEGKMDATIENRSTGITFFGIISAIILGIFNLVK
jgi:hypothetical protein